MVLSRILATKNINQIFKCQIVFIFVFPPISTFMWFTVNENCLMLAVTLTRLRSLFSTRSTCSLFLFLFFIINLTVKLFYCLLSGWGVSPFLSCCICDFKSFIYTSLRFSEANSFETFYFVRVSIIFLDFFFVFFFCFCIYVCVCRRIASVVGVHLVVQGMLCWWAVSSVSDPGWLLVGVGSLILFYLFIWSRNGARFKVPANTSCSQLLKHLDAGSRSSPPRKPNNVIK